MRKFSNSSRMDLDIVTDLMSNLGMQVSDVMVELIGNGSKQAIAVCLDIDNGTWAVLYFLTKLSVIMDCKFLVNDVDGAGGESFCFVEECWGRRTAFSCNYWHSFPCRPVWRIFAIFPSFSLP